MLTANTKLLPTAQVLKSYGVAGECYITLYSTMPIDINLDEPVFFYFEELPVPFFMETFKKKGTNKAIVKFENIDSLTQAEELVGKKIYYRDDLLENEDEEGELEALIGFTLFDQEGKELGQITDVNDYSGNICIEVGDNLYPLHEELILELVESSKRLQIEIPEGL